MIVVLPAPPSPAPSPPVRPKPSCRCFPTALAVCRTYGTGFATIDSAARFAPGSEAVRCMSNFRPIDRDTGFLLPPSLDEWPPERHLARFVVGVIGGLDLSAMHRSYRGTGSASYHPKLLLGILVYGYATGVFSSRKLERATYDSVAFRFIAPNDHPDHDTIAAFRRRFLPRIEGLFVQVLLLAREMGLFKLGTVALDGAKVQANASRHSALSYEHAGKIEDRKSVV